MQISFVVAVVVAICYGQSVYGDAEDIENHANECMKTTGATEADLQVLEGIREAKTKEQACLAACFYKKLGFMGSDNKLVLEYALQILSGMSVDAEMRNNWKSLFTYCSEKQQPEPDECNAAKNILHCLAERAQQIGLKDIE